MTQVISQPHLFKTFVRTTVSLTNLFVATAGTNTRNAAFKIVHSDLLNILSAME